MSLFRALVLNNNLTTKKILRVKKMKDKQNESVRQSVKSSFSDLVRASAEQIDISEFEINRPFLVAQARELCAIIAEVYAMHPDTEIYVSGEKLYAGLVAEVLRCVSFEHAELVLDNYNKVQYPIRNKRVYLRTALYNSVFELTSSIANEVNSG